MSRLRISFLGAFSVTLDDKPITGFESDKVRALFAYLSVETERPHRREKLAGLFWPEMPERQARHNLRQALFNLRTTIRDHEATPPYLTVNTQTLARNPINDAWLDVQAFYDASDGCQEGNCGGKICDICLNQLEKAAELYRRQFLDDLSLSGCQKFNKWALVESERLHRRAVYVHEKLVECQLSMENTTKMLDIARNWTTLDPYNEGAHRSVMLGYALTGQQAAALSQYNTCCQILGDELGLAPSHQTQKLYELLEKDELPKDFFSTL